MKEQVISRKKFPFPLDFDSMQKRRSSLQVVFEFFYESTAARFYEYLFRSSPEKDQTLLHECQANHRSSEDTIDVGKSSVQESEEDSCNSDLKQDGKPLPKVPPCSEDDSGTEDGSEDCVATEWDKGDGGVCLLYTSPSPRDNLPSRMPSSA